MPNRKCPKCPRNTAVHPCPWHRDEKLKDASQEDGDST
jgi:hypothetical protein